MSVCRFVKTLLLVFEWTEGLKLTDCRNTLTALFSHAFCTVVCVCILGKSIITCSAYPIIKSPPLRRQAASRDTVQKQIVMNWVWIHPLLEDDHCYSRIDGSPSAFKQKCYYWNAFWQGGYTFGLTISITCLTFGIVLAGSYFAFSLNYLASDPSFFNVML